MPKVYRTQIEVRGYELDSFGHVNNANYLNYLEYARWKLLGDEGVTHETFRDWKRWPVIAAIDIQYLKPAFMDDVLTVESKIVDYGRSSMRIEQVILKKGVLIAQAKVRSVIVDEHGKPAELPKVLEAKWRNVVVDESGAV